MNAPALLGSILVNGISLGCVYASVSIAYDVMFSVPRVMSFTAGPVGMVGGVLGAFFVGSLKLPPLLGLMATALSCSAVGVLIGLVAVRPVLAVLERHLGARAHRSRLRRLRPGRWSCSWATTTFSWS